MRDLLLLAIHLLVTLAKLLGPGGTRQVAAESLLLKHQLLISNRSRQRAPNLTMLDRLVLGLTTLFVSPHRIPKLSAILRPATLFEFHKALVHRKYRLLFSSSRRKRKPGPKGPSTQLIAAIVEMKRRNPKFGCVRIAQQINYAFGIKIDKDVVRRVLATHCRPEPGADGPSWLTLIAHAKDSVWSVDLFRVESILLRSHWVMLVMDVFTRNESLGSASLPRPLMACRCAACSIAPLLGNRNRNTSVRITIHSFVFTAGSQTCACWRSRKLNRFRPLRFHIRLSSVSSEQSGGSTLIGYFFGTPRTWRASCTNTKCITTRIESIVRSAARPPRYAPAYPQLLQPRLTVTRGGHIAAVCFRLRSPPDLYFATHRSISTEMACPCTPSAFPLLATTERTSLTVRFVPSADIREC